MQQSHPKERVRTYRLYRWVIHRQKNGKATIHLHGQRYTFFGGKEKRIEYITVRMLPDETETELIRCAIAQSPNKWKVSFFANISQFGGKLYTPLDERLRSTITHPS
jgi:hypothetical protein